MAWYGHNMNYQQTRDYYLRRLKQNLGDDNFNKIQHKVKESNIVNKFINKCTDYGTMPNQLTLIEQVQMARAFWFTMNYNKIFLAALILLDWWNTEINSKRRLATDNDLVDNVERIALRTENLINGRA